jgi:hypothetical protein
VALEFEQEWSGMWAEVRFSIRCQHLILEQASIEESRIGLSRFHAIAGLFREDWDCELFPDLETHLEILRDLVEIVFELTGGRWPVEGGIIADGSERALPRCIDTGSTHLSIPARTTSSHRHTCLCGRRHCALDSWRRIRA